MPVTLSDEQIAALRAALAVVPALSNAQAMEAAINKAWENVKLPSPPPC